MSVFQVKSILWDPFPVMFIRIFVHIVNVFLTDGQDWKSLFSEPYVRAPGE
jgi:hypothetical protein